MSDPRKTLATVEALGSVLKQEIAALTGGQFGDLVRFSSEKSRLTTLLESQLQHDPESVSKEKLAGLSALIAQDTKYLQQAQQATAEMMKEVSAIRERHSAAGIYGRSGAKRDNYAIARSLVDKSF